MIYSLKLTINITQVTIYVWPDGVLGLQFRGCEFDSGNNLGQVVHTHLLFLLSSKVWYYSKGTPPTLLIGYSQ